MRVGRFLAKYVIEKCLSALSHFYMIGTWQKLENFTQSYSLLVLCLVEAQFFLNASKKNILPKTSVFLFWSHFFGDIDVPYFAHTQKLKKGLLQDTVNINGDLVWKFQIAMMFCSCKSVTARIPKHPFEKTLFEIRVVMYFSAITHFKKSFLNTFIATLI